MATGSTAKQVQFTFAESAIKNNSVHFSFQDESGTPVNIQMPANQLRSMIENLERVEQVLTEASIDCGYSNSLVPSPMYPWWNKDVERERMKKMTPFERVLQVIDEQCGIDHENIVYKELGNIMVQLRHGSSGETNEIMEDVVKELKRWRRHEYSISFMCVDERQRVNVYRIELTPTE